MKKFLYIFTCGFALFSMFFGSGNLVFPLSLGKLFPESSLMATFGLNLTAVLVPFLGALAMLLHRGDLNSFFGWLGNAATFWFPLLSLSLMGPFGVLARCLTVAHGGIEELFPDISLIFVSLSLCVLIFIFSLRQNRIVSLLGSFLTPILLISLFLIAYFGWDKAKFEVQAFSMDSFKQGLIQGYQTMDLLAAFFFSSFVIKEMRSKAEDDRSLFQLFLGSALVGMGLLSLIYFFMISLGAFHALSLVNVPDEKLLSVISTKTMGSFAGIVVTVAASLACFTTGLVLAKLFADFLFKEIFKEKVSKEISMICTLLIAFFVSTLEFSGIAKILGPILDFIYPALIVLTLMSIANKLWGIREKRWPVAIALALKAALSI